MELGRTIFMERSHLDDELFLREHQLQGNISASQSAAYDKLSQVLHEQMPAPDVLILMNPNPELSIERVSLAEQRGDRPYEFPNEELKRQWIYRWYNLYEEFHAQLPTYLAQDPRMAKTRLLTLDPANPQEGNIDRVMQLLDMMGAVPRATDPVV
jgi:deoxyadenosine/deoxycytidine kinase